MIDRRKFLGMAAGAGATLALTPQLLRALQASQGPLIQRAIPSSGEMVPAISYGARPLGGAAQVSRPEDVAAIKEVLKTLLDNGGRVVDVLHGGPGGEQAARTAAAELGIQNRLFWTTVLSAHSPGLPGHPAPPPDPAAVSSLLEAKLATFKVPQIDLVMTSSESTHLAVAREMKREGLVRYTGVHFLLPAGNAPIPPELEAVVRNEEIDFIGTDYSVIDRRLEEKILPLAQERKIGVMAYFPFDRAKGLQRASNTPLPEWAAEFDARTWAQFFLKYVISHPAIIMARTGTTTSAHMLDNIGGGIGRLPDEAMRRRMADLVDSFPTAPPPTVSSQPPQPPQPQAPAVVLPAALLDRYVGEYVYVKAGQTLTIRRDGERLLLKSGGLPEGALVARSETRFALWMPGTAIEFQLDGQARVTGAIYEGGPNRIPLERR